MGEFEPGSPEQNEANPEVGNRAAQTVHGLVDFCLVTVNLLKTLLVILPYPRASVAVMITQFYKTTAIELEKACIL